MHFIVKKTLQIIINQENNYLVKLKANQPNLLKAVSQIVQTSNAIDQYNETKRARGRAERRFVSLYNPTEAIPKDWPELNKIVHVERIFSSKAGYHHTHSYYISSLKFNDAKLFATGVRGHWSIENNLHWVKDVILKEDTTHHIKGYASKNMSILRNIAINVFRKNEYSSTKHATLFFASNVKELLEIIFRT
jgi:predicted transposase YbfD/YdcC